MKKIGLIGGLLVLSSAIAINSLDRNDVQDSFQVKMNKGTIVEPHIGITEKNRESVGALLNVLLSDEYLLYTKTLNFHWNVVGMNFNDLHLFFGKQYEQLSEFVDEVAERARMLGVRSLGTMSEFLKHTRLKEEAGVVSTEKEMIKKLLDDHEAIIRFLRVDLERCVTEFQDVGTNNFLTDLLEKHEKMAWMLRSYLQG